MLEVPVTLCMHNEILVWPEVFVLNVPCVQNAPVLLNDVSQ